MVDPSLFRVLGQLGSDLKLGAWLAFANIALAITAFAEPILFGRIIDVLTRAQGAGAAPVTFSALGPLILAWVAFGLFTIGAGVLVALHADRLSHRAAARRHGQLFRARARIAARLPHVDPFGPGAEGDARGLERHGLAVARLLPGALLAPSSPSASCCR